MKTDKQEKFIDHYCKTGNATQSAIASGSIQAGDRGKNQENGTGHGSYIIVCY
jgi:phage terminase small subunit